MTLQVQTSHHGIVTPSSTTYKFFNGFIKDGLYYGVTGEPRLRIFNVDTLAPVYADSSNGTGTYAGITLIAPGSAIIGNSGTARFDWVNIADSNYPKGVTTTNAQTIGNGNNPQQGLDGNPDIKVAVAHRGASVGVQVIDGNNFTVTPITTASTIFASTVGSCVIRKEGTNNWLVGFKNGTIIEMSSGGSIIQSVTLPQTPAAVALAAPSYATSLAYYNDRVLATAHSGALYLINWSASSILDTMPVEQGQTSAVSTILSNSASGLAMLCSSFTQGQQIMREVRFDQDRITIESTYYPSKVILASSVVIDPIKNKVIMSSNSTGLEALTLFKITPMNKINVPTRIQDSSVDIPGRIIRIRDNDNIGRSSVELDTNILAGETQLGATEGHSYIEIAIKSGSPEKYDIREFRA